jgi:GT2 family glycosyltransferase
MRYSVITLCHNKLACTQRCLTALLRDSVADAPWELLVVDNGSTDGTGAWLERDLVACGRAVNVPVRVLRSDVNIGCSPARNLGIAAATGDYLVFVDNDVTPCTRRWLPGLRAVLEADPVAGMVGPKMIYPTPPYAIQCAGVGVSTRGHICFRGRGQPNDDPRFNQRQPVQSLISACLMVRAELIRAHGGFDKAFHPVQFEDFDLCYRLRELGWQAIYEPGVAMYHFESVTTQGSPTICNAAVVVRNGLIFQQRWRHLFSREDGPMESECRWRQASLPTLDAIADPPLA